MVYKIFSGEVQSDTIFIEDLTIEKDEETITVTTKKVDGNLVYTITKKMSVQEPFSADILYFIDGKEALATTVKNLNPNFIKSINVLKGSATSKYGEKGKNGVIEIITKK